MPHSRGVTLIEYLLLIAAVSLIAIYGIKEFGKKVNQHNCRKIIDSQKMTWKSNPELVAKLKEGFGDTVYSTSFVPEFTETNYGDPGYNENKCTMSIILPSEETEECNPFDPDCTESSAGSSTTTFDIY